MGLDGKLEVVIEIKSSGDKYWEALLDSTALFPKIFPQHYMSIQLLQGDGRSVGTIKKILYGVPTETEVKEKIVHLDEANKTAVSEVIEGEVLKYFKNFNVTVHVNSKGDACNVTWSIQYEKIVEEIPDPDEIAENAKKILTELDDYLVSH